MGETLMILKPRIIRRDEVLGQIRSVIDRLGCRISEEIVCRPGRDFWTEFYKHNSKESWFPEFLDFIDSEEAIFLIVNGPDRGKLDFETWFRDLLLPLRKIYGQDDRANAFHMSDGKQAARWEAGLILRYELEQSKRNRR